MTCAELNVLDQKSFEASLGGVFEHSPWVAHRAWARGPFADITSLHQAMVAEVRMASRDEQLALIRAHPDLGTRARISRASEAEQSGAGLGQLSETELQALDRLNAAYKEKFGFPFILAVKGRDKHMVLRALEERVVSSAEEEFEESLDQISRIAMFRLEAIFWKGDR